MGKVILDPEREQILQEIVDVLDALGEEHPCDLVAVDGIDDVRVGKSVRFDLQAADEVSARAQVDDLCQRFLTNPVIEDAGVSVAEVQPA